MKVLHVWGCNSGKSSRTNSNMIFFCRQLLGHLHLFFLLTMLNFSLKLTDVIWRSNCVQMLGFLVHQFDFYGGAEEK